MQKKITVDVNGRKVRIMPHMINDAAKFGATQERKVIKETPKELLKPIIPQMKKVEPEKVVFEPLPTVDNTLKISVPKTRKPPVKSKSKK